VESAIVAADAIVSVDGKPIRAAREFGAAIAAHRPGDEGTLGVVRGARSRTVTVVLGNAPSTP
jgi:serine protease Do